MVTGVIVDIGSLATAVGVFVTGWQLWLNRRQARTQFEDGLVSRYRELVRELPVAVFLEKEVDEGELQSVLGPFYRYFDLCNEQAFLNEERRINRDTWVQWCDGIESNMRRRPF